jgi:hypothetical protein
MGLLASTAISAEGNVQAPLLVRMTSVDGELGRNSRHQPCEAPKGAMQGSDVKKYHRGW